VERNSIYEEEGRKIIIHSLREKNSSRSNHKNKIREDFKTKANVDGEEDCILR